LLGGFSEDEQDQLIGLMEQIGGRRDTMQPIGEVAERVVARIPRPPPASAPASARAGWAGLASSRPIDPERMRLVEERGRMVARWISEALGNELGWIVLVFGTGDASELTYLSNCPRDDCVRLLREYTEVLAERQDFPPGVLTQRAN